jgi:putative membrane protein
MNLLISMFLMLPNTSSTLANQRLDDQQISAIVNEANDADIEISKEAKKKSNNPEVKFFAEKMMNAHQESNHALQKVMEKANIKTKKNSKSADIKTTKRDTKNNLKNLHGVEFDKAFMHNEVQTHASTLDTLDQELIPNALSPNLKDFLEQTRRTVAEHLDHAKQLDSKVNF